MPWITIGGPYLHLHLRSGSGAVGCAALEGLLKALLLRRLVYSQLGLIGNQSLPTLFLSFNVKVKSFLSQYTFHYSLIRLFFHYLRGQLDFFFFFFGLKKYFDIILWVFNVLSYLLKRKWRKIYFISLSINTFAFWRLMFKKWQNSYKVSDVNKKNQSVYFDHHFRLKSNHMCGT